MMMKRLTAIFLCIALSAAMFCACANDKNQGNTVMTTEATTLAKEALPARPEEKSFESTIENSFSNIPEPSAESFTYTVSDRGVTLTGYKGELTRLTLPAEIEGKPVRAIAQDSFADLEKLTVLVIPKSIESIGKGALRGCTSLTALKLPFIGGTAASEQYLGHLFGASNYTDNSKDIPASLQILEIWDGIPELAPFALYDCNDLLAIKLPQSIKLLRSYSVFQCERLEYINVSHLQGLEAGALGNCKALTSLRFGEGLTFIGLGALEGCAELRSLTLPFVGGSATENTYLAYIFGAQVPDFAAGYYPQKMIEVNLLSTCKSLGNYAFYECARLVYLTLSEGITSIGVRAFDGCERLRELHIPSSVRSIGENAFFSCLRLEKISFGENSALTVMGINTFYDCISLQEVTLPQALQALPASCFADCVSLTRVNLGGVKTVGKNAFRNCSALTDVKKNGEVVFEEGNEAAQPTVAS